MHLNLSLLFIYLHTSGFAKGVLVRGRGPEPVMIKRLVCNSDNVLRALKSNSVSASPFCSSLINIPGVTTFKSVAGVTATTITVTTTRISTIIPNYPSPLPTYVSQYPTSRVSSACSCLSVSTSTESDIASVSTVYLYTTLATTTTETGACATGIIYPGAHLVTGQFANAYNLTLGGASDPYNCCLICNSNGAFSSCVGWAWLDGDCQSVLEGGPYADYMQPPCTRYGKQPVTIYVDKTKYPGDIGGKGQCASKLTIVNG